jgi:dienelactone hydrolase
MQMTRRRWMAISGAAAAGGAAHAQDIHREIRAMADQAPLSMRFLGGSADDCRRWQREFSARLGELLGDFRPPSRWETVTERSVELEDHRREELVLRAEGHRPLPVYVLTPRGASQGPRPGVVALHGHGPHGHDAVAGIAPTPERRRNLKEINYDYGLQLALRGYIVAAPCLTPFGRRLDDPKAYRGEDPCAITFVRMQLLGKILMAENLRDALWSLELLSQRPGVDAGRLGCVGLSYGGRMTMLTSALSPKVRVAVISGALNVMQERVQGRYGCGAQVIPGLLKYGDVPEIGSLIAPRPCLWEVGKKDSLMVKNRIEPALGTLRRAYEAFGAAPMLDVDSFDGGHRWNGDKAYPLLARVLRP